ncbi:MAG: hypothetical protein QM727_09420 [Niabella sp.]
MKGVINRRYIVLLLAVCLAAAAYAQPVHIKATVDKQQILLGEPFRLKIETSAEHDYVLPFKIVAPAHFEILNDSIYKHTQDGKKIVQQVYELTSFDSGRWAFPPQLLFRGVQTNPFEIAVVFSEPFNPEQPYHDIQDIRDVPIQGSFEKWWYATAVMLILLTLIIYFTTDKKPKPKQKVNVRQADAFRLAMDSLEELKKRTDSPKVIYMESIEVFRAYVLQRTGIESLQQTSPDLLNRLKPYFEKKELFLRLENALQVGDFIKFAKYNPSESEVISAIITLGDAVSYIEALVKEKGIINNT